MQRFAIILLAALIPAALTASAPTVFGQTLPPQGTATSSPAKPGQVDKDAPVQIEAATLEVHDKTKTATFSGNVQVVQGDTAMRCRSLVVFYGQEVGLGDATSEVTTGTVSKPPLGGAKGAQNVRRIEARGGVTVLTKDQSATGDLGIYDLKTETGNARVESGGSGAGTGAAGSGRVRALIQPGKGQGGPSNFMTIGPGRPN